MPRVTGPRQTIDCRCALHPETTLTAGHIAAAAVTPIPANGAKRTPVDIIAPKR